MADDDSPSVSFADGPGPGEGSDGEAAAAKGDISKPKKATTMTADELADEEWGPVKTKEKKGKKGKKGKGKNVEDDEELPAEDATAPAQQEENEASKQPVEMTAEELADEEWGPVKEKGGKKGKGKKGKKGGKAEDADEEDEQPGMSI